MTRATTAPTSTSSRRTDARAGIWRMNIRASLWRRHRRGTQTPAQDLPRVVSELRVEADDEGVNLVSGRTQFELPVLSVPAAPNLRFDRIQNAAPYVIGRVTGQGGEIPVGNWTMHMPGATESFLLRLGGFAQMAAAIIRGLLLVKYISGVSRNIAWRAAVWSLIALWAAFSLFNVAVIPGQFRGRDT
jgi:hypothetical protein